MVEKVYTALAYIFDRLQELQKQPTDPEVIKYCSISVQVQRYLRRAISEKPVAQFARSRLVAETHHVIYANKHLAWQKMHEAALGMEYLDGQNIAHNDLKCDNVLVGMDSKAKLIDFSLSCLLSVAEIQMDVKRMDALHWKSPKYSTGGCPSFAFDVCSFAMRVLEGVTGDIPWGKQMSPVFVKFQVKKGNISTLPDILSDKQRNLIEPMMRKDPMEHVKMSFVVDKLLEIAKFEAESQSSS